MAFRITGFGPFLEDNIRRIKFLLAQQKQVEEQLQKHGFSELNEERRKRTLELLREEGKAICLLHQEIFSESTAAEWLRRVEEISAIRMTAFELVDGTEKYDYPSSA